MEPNQFTNQDRLPFLSARQLCAAFGIPEVSFRILLHRARKLGIPMPSRRRLGRRYLYDVKAFSEWAWEHADALRGEFEFRTKSDADEDDE